MPKDINIWIGSIVKAKMGRDKDKFFVVTGFIGDNYVLMADGLSRTVKRPKKKKLKHILVMKDVLLEVKNKILLGKCVLDADIRKGLKSMRYIVTLNKFGFFAILFQISFSYYLVFRMLILNSE